VLVGLAASALGVALALWVHYVFVLLLVGSSAASPAATPGRSLRHGID
jgi:hypothetical protein